MTKRIKSHKETLPITNWEKADEYLRIVGDQQGVMKQAENKAKERIDKIKSQLAETVRPFQDSIDLYVRSLEAFADAHADDFGKQRSRKLNFGRIGWRKSTSIRIKKKTLELIKKVFSKAKAEQFIITNEKPDREALAKLTDKRLAGIKARREIKDDFFVEPNLTEAADHSGGND